MPSHLNIQINLTSIFLFRAHSNGKQIASNYAIHFVSVRLLFVLVKHPAAKKLSIDVTHYLSYLGQISCPTIQPPMQAQKISNLGAGQLPISKAGSSHWIAWGQPREHTACGMPSPAVLQRGSYAIDFSNATSPA